jgi:hypothetical protein
MATPSTRSRSRWFFNMTQHMNCLLMNAQHHASYSIRHTTLHHTTLHPHHSHILHRYLKAKLFAPDPDMTNDVVWALQEKYHGKGLLEVLVYPEKCMIWFHPATAKLFTEYGTWFSIDTTFNMGEGKLMLTTLITVVNGVTLAVAAMLHNSKSKHTYTAFLEQVL